MPVQSNRHGTMQIVLVVILLFCCFCTFLLLEIKSVLNKPPSNSNGTIDYTVKMRSNCLSQDELRKRATDLQNRNYQDVVSSFLSAEDAATYVKRCGESEYVEKYTTIIDVQTDAIDFDSSEDQTQSLNTFRAGDNPIIFYPRNLTAEELPTKLTGVSAISYAGIMFVDINNAGIQKIGDIPETIDEVDIFGDRVKGVQVTRDEIDNRAQDKSRNDNGVKIETRSVGVILFNAPNFQFGNPNITEQVKQVLFTDPKSVANYYHTVSLGKLNLQEGGITEGWLTYSKEINLSDAFCRDGAIPLLMRNLYDEFDRRKLLSEGIKNADSLIFISPLFGTSTPRPGTECRAFSAYASLGKNIKLGGKQRYYVFIKSLSSVYSNDGGYALLTHEIGHNNNFGHAGGISDSLSFLSIYGNMFDTMGSISPKYAKTLRGSLSPIFLAYKKWLKDPINFRSLVNVEDLSINVPKTVVIKAVGSDYADNQGPFLVELKGIDYYLEYKSANWITLGSPVEPVGGVLVTKPYLSFGMDGTVTIDTKPGTCTGSSSACEIPEREEFEDALIKPGENYVISFGYNKGGRLRITTISANNTEGTVQVTLLQKPPRKDPPDRTK